VREHPECSGCGCTAVAGVSGARSQSLLQCPVLILVHSLLRRALRFLVVRREMV